MYLREKMLTFILGGIRSGKSRYAGEIVDEISKNENKKAIYIATYRNDGKDAEMAERIERHKKNRPRNWDVIEAGKISDVVSKIREIENSVIIIDCVTLLVSNFLEENKKADENDITKEIEKMITEIRETIKKGHNKVIVISNEVGQGIIPANKISRKYVDLLGRANQIIARHSDKFYFMFAGIPSRIK